MSLDRRQFVKVAASAIVAGASATGCSRDASDSTALDHPQLIQMLGADRVRGLGAQYRARVPAEDSAPALRAAISAERSVLHLPWFRKSVDETVRDDFAAGRTVLVDGWVLSITEARQAALFSLPFA